ncbi:MAG TPA: septum site-determining protein Ssd [Pseudonocardia sp.]|uniref:septum site-determining protein Ssd n=1 Tax=Pseudonocardia sp. TaxID=60912 RepID=UPI002B4B0E24|nr:septum site-determining protein Ssd [Pseudonocardia sp.]HLU59995.1 septum site-determining protein Ssd [Pseudonocardia sp.]
MRSRETTERTGPPRRGLVMVSDPDLLDALLRLAAAAGCEVQRAVDPPQARPYWSDAPLVLLDAAAAAQCARAGLPRRGDVIVAVRGAPPPSVWRHAVAVGAEHVVALPEAEQWLVAALTDAAEGPRPGGTVLAVVGGRGGAGASVLAAAVAVTAVREGGRALLVDCDPLGGGLDLVLGAEDLGGLRWPGIGVEDGRVPAAALHAALPSPRIGRRDGALAVLSCDRSSHGPAPAAVRAVVEAGRRAGDVVVCDLPRHPTDAAAAALAVADLVALVVTADVRACAAGARVAATLAAHGRPVRAVVRGPAPGGIDADEVARAVGVPLLAAMRPEPGLARALERGEAPPRPHGPLAGTARTVLAAVREASESRP